MIRARSLGVSCLFVVLALFGRAAPAHAQFNSAIQGTVTDAQHSIVPGATVTVTNATTGVTRTVVTGTDGVYRVLSLGPGTYRLEVEMAGFLTTKRDGIDVGISETVRVDVALDVATVSESVTVQSKQAAVETTQGRVSGRVDRVQLQEMPLNGRNLYNLIALQPGVTGVGISSTFGAGGAGNDSFSGESAPRINASGQRDEANNFTVDDTSTNGVARGGITNLTPNAESVEEVRVVSNNFSAEYGRNSGAQIQVITKAGTNDFHGSLSYYFQNNTLSAKNVFEQSVPVYRKNQFGYAVGGPILQNRTFFFTSYEGLRQSGGRGSSFVVETPAFRNFVLQTRPNSLAAQLMQTFAPAIDPSTNFRDLGSPANGANAIGPADGIADVGSAFYVPSASRDGNQFQLRIDHELRPGKDRLYGNFYRTTSYTLNGSIRPAFNVPVAETTYYGNLNHTHIFSPTKLNEVRAGVMRLVGLPDTPQHLEIPGITITGATGFGQSNYPRGWWQTNYDVKDTFTWVPHSHTLKMGAEVRRMYGRAQNTNNYIPAYSFTSILSFANDQPIQMTRYVDPRTGEPVTVNTQLASTEWAAFINDDWKVSPTLTVNIGLRYENFGTLKDTDDILRNLIPGSGATFAEQLAGARVDFVDQFYPTDDKNVGPRIGFAWDPTATGRMAVRGGYGIAYDRLMNLPAENYRHSPPLRASVVLGQFYGTNFTYSLGDASKPYLGYPVDPALQVGLDERNGVKGARVAVTAVNPTLTSPYAHNWFLGVQRDIGHRIVVDANYIGSAGHHLINVYNANRYAGDLLDGRFDGYNPSFSTIQYVDSGSNSIYHGATLQVKRNFNRGFTVQGAYTFGHAINDTDAAVGTTDYQDAANRAAERATAGYDATHKLTLMGLWDLPFFKTSGPLLNGILGGWQFSGFAIFQSGTPLTVVNNGTYPRGDFNADGNAGDRPNAPGGGVKTSGWSNADYLSGIFLASDFPAPAPGTDGNLGRNTYRGPGFAEVDLSLSKKFTLTHTLTTEVRLDMFNALNRVNLANPIMDLSNANFGRSTSQLAPRTLQAGLRFRF